MDTTTQFQIGKAYASEAGSVYIVTGITAKTIRLKGTRGKEYTKSLRTSKDGVGYFLARTGPYGHSINATQEMSLDIFNSMS